MNNSHLVAAIVLLMFACCQPATSISQQVRIEIDSQDAALTHPLIVLDDIASIRCSDPGTLAKLKKLDLDVVPTTGFATISKRQIEVRIQLAGLSNLNTVLSGPDQIRVKKAVPDLFKTQLENLIQRELASQFAIPVIDVSVMLTNPNRLAEIQSKIDTQDFAAVPVFPNRLPLGDKQLRIDFSDRSGNRVSTTVETQITVMKEVQISKQRISKGTEITSESILSIKRPLIESRSLPADRTTCLASVAKNDIEPHEVVLTSHLAPTSTSRQILLKRNDLVDVVLQSGPINIRLKNAVVMTEGGIGERVQVMNPETKKRFAALVQDKATVLVRMR